VGLTVSVQRRVGNSYVSVITREPVLPDEQIRLFATGADYTNSVEFVIKTAAGTIVLNENRGVGILNGESVLDTVAPLTEGRYTVNAFARKFNPFPMMNQASAEFWVAETAAQPPAKEPVRRGVPGVTDEATKKIEGVLKYGVIGAIAILGILVVMQFGKRQKT